MLDISIVQHSKWVELGKKVSKLTFLEQASFLWAKEQIIEILRYMIALHCIISVNCN